MQCERQLTTGDCNHMLTNVGVWSHDSAWIYYDVRSEVDGSSFDGLLIERIHVQSGKVETVYQASHGAYCGVVTANPVTSQIVFIHGPEFPTKEWSYSAWHRRGVTLRPEVETTPTNLDARNFVSPYTPGALRGGSHVHTFSGDGLWISFTYEDHVLATSDSPRSGRNQRNIGVAAPYGPVLVPKSHPRNHSGSAFSVLVTKTTDAPRSGSDDITRAYSDAWIGKDGYLAVNGSRQKRAIAFIGNVLGADGIEVPELFVVDIPQDVTRSGKHALCGTKQTRPYPPHGTVQRRLTHTTERKYPGLGAVRHWPRSSPDGSKIAFLMRDDEGKTQLWTISPHGKDLNQLTHNVLPMESAFTWRPDGLAIACVANQQIYEILVETGETVPLMASPEQGSSLRPEAVVYSPDGTLIAYMKEVKSLDGAKTINHIFLTRSQFALNR